MEAGKSFPRASHAPSCRLPPGPERHRGGPRGLWALAWVRKLIVKPETSRSEIHSVQRTCLGRGWGVTGRQESCLPWRWRGEGPEPYLMGLAFLTAQWSRPDRPTMAQWAGALQAPRAQPPHLPKRQGGRGPGKGAGGGMCTTGGERVPSRPLGEALVSQNTKKGQTPVAKNGGSLARSSNKLAL